MTGDVFKSLSYGMYALGVSDGQKTSASIVSSVAQVSNSPDVISVSVSHSNFSHECIEKTGLFTISVLSEDTSGAVIGALGFNSGRDTDKLNNIAYRVLAEGVPVVKESICCWFLCRVVGGAETRGHTVMFAEVLAGSETVKGTPMTYNFYRSVIKGRVPKNSPIYREEKPSESETDGNIWICPVCGFAANNPLAPFEELPENWVCPVCGAPKAAFRRQTS